MIVDRRNNGVLPSVTVGQVSRHLRSSQGILVGGAGADTITGGTGRSLLIGDQGADQITGGSTSGGDILIGGAVYL